MSNEYTKHFRAMFPSMAPFSAGIILVFIALNIFFVNLIMPRYKELASLRVGTYDWVVVSSSNVEGFPRLKKLSNLVTFRNADDVRTNINTYVQTDNLAIVNSVLKADEIAISEKMANRLDLDIGSIINADLPIYDTPTTYHVKVVLPYLSDLYNIQENQDFSYAIIGYDKDLYNQLQGNSVYLLDAYNYDEYFEKNYPYSGKYNLLDEISSIKRWVLIACILANTLMMLTVLFVALYLHKGINKEVDKYYRDGFEILDVKYMNLKDHILYLGVPILIEMICIIVYQTREGKLIPYLLLAIGELIIIFSCLSVLGGRRYGRAN